ncbi:MAG: ABC transporter substrate-binding protein [Magnetococcales bacterium]|nr:ABC transporter substrate-binding protein [Magnetococcales bacterium]
MIDLRVPLLIVLLVPLLLFTPVGSAGDPPIKTVISVVGPRNLSFLPIDLIPAIGADRDEGIEVQLRHVDGGGVAIKEVVSRNSDFTAVGFAALMSLKANGGELIGVAAISDATQFVLAVRKPLEGEVTRIADLKGRIVGVHTSAVNAKTMSQQLLEMLLKSDGLQPREARVISSGQDWRRRAMLLDSGQMDAIVSEEPFATWLLQQEKVFFLRNLADPDSNRDIAGSRVLHVTVATRPDVIAHEPEKVKRLVNAVRRSLRWIAEHTPEEVVERLGITNDEEKGLIQLCLRTYPRLFSRDGAFSNLQIKETNQFFHAGGPETSAVRMEDLINDQWAGRKE